MAQATLLTYFQPKPPEVRVDLPRVAQEKPPKDQQRTPRSRPAPSTQALPSSEVVSGISVHEGNADSRTCPKSLVRLLDPRAQISKVEWSHTASLKRLTSSTLPIRYHGKFFDEAIRDEQAADLSRVVLYDEKPIGWIRCRLESSPGLGSKPVNQIYIQALCLLAPYRNCGFGSLLLDSVMEAETLKKYNVTFVYAHVWEDNEEALVWYEKRSFKRTFLVDQYYRRLKPSGAWVVRRDLG